ncbi:multidrug transporter MatE [Betaproteobacteria bacterium]|nr:multidrug transporter MatE [Betaproteobacteria bacterium]GHT99937.1 multidrug transporter MatE [Betaproteobacteria bacterium]GHU22033.1 multidrug transporter MatE [Betaproteobacteria bacterium]
MKLNIQKWGNSAAVRLPSAMLAQMGAKIGDAFVVDVFAQKAELRVARPHYTLNDLLAEMPEGLPRVEDWDALPDVGKERV